jgi:hypothetical protein
LVLGLKKFRLSFFVTKPWQLAAIFILCLLAITLAFKSCVDSAAGLPGAMLRGTGSATAESIKNITRVFTEAFSLTPTIIQDHKVVLQQSAPIAEFAVLKKEGAYEFTWIHTWLGSEKKIEIKGTYRAKAGFDLSEPFTVTLEKDGTVRADLPPARLLSLEKTGDLDFNDSNGWFNKVTSAERSEVLNTFEHKVREEMLQAGLLQEAEKQALERLQDLARRNGQEMIFRFKKESTTPIAAP